jgi:hypothetical protein
MVPKKSLFFAGATLLCMSTAFAQNQSKKVSRVSNKVMNTATVDLQTGVITRGPAIQQKAAAGSSTATSVNNLDFGGFIGIDSGENGLNGPCEWFSSVQKGTGATGGQSTYLSSFLFAYCGIAQDLNSGGPGTSVTMNFWDGFTNGAGSVAGSTGTNVGSVTVTGLPGNTGVTGWLTGGFAACVSFLVGVNVGGGVPIVLPDSNVAVSFLFTGLDGNSVLGDTATFLSCVASCSGVGVADGVGMVDVIDNYCGGTFLTSFSFVTGGPFTQSFTSVSFLLTEVVPLDASDSQVINNGPTGCNSSTIATTSAPFIGGGAWTQDISCGTIPGSLTVSFSSFVPINPAVCGTSATGDFLVNPTAGRIGLLTKSGSRAGGMATLAIAPGVPLNLMFVGAAVNSQGYCAGAPVPSGQTRLTNRTTICIGTLE